ncbi:hypothetical protein P8452_33139 [Trifolium repens]|nr:hypothetical protein P8452_33139 [Trifolium repens]
MTGDRKNFLTFEEKEGGSVTFGNNEKAQIKGKGTIGKVGSAKIENVHYVEGLKHNLISISQLCDNGFEVIFKTNTCEIKQSSCETILFSGSRIKNVYVVYLDELPTESCFVSLEKDKWTWHKRVGHVSMKTISKLSKLDLVNNLGKFDSKSDKGIFLGYSLTSKAYRIYNLRTQTLEESMHVKFDEFEEQPSTMEIDDEELELIRNQNDDPNQESPSQQLPKTWKTVTNHPPEKIIGNTEDGIRTRRSLQIIENNLGLISQLEPRTIDEAIIDESWVEAMKEELSQFERNEVWNLVPLPKNHSIIGTRWVFRNKLDENGIDYDETFAPVASEFEMSMMGELRFFLGLQIKQLEDGIFICQEKYIKDLLKKYKMNEAKIMSTPMHPSTSLDKDENGKNVSEKEFRGMIGSLLYLTASRPDIVFSVGLCARFQSSPKESHLVAVKRIFRYLVGTQDVGLWYKKGTHFDLKAYCDADYAGDKIERKSTSGACQFLGEALVSWCCRKQNTIALSTTEAEYVSASNCCSQVIWIKNQLEDFSLRYTNVQILCDNTSAINLSKNPIEHSRSKHIEIKHHFIRDHVNKKDISLVFVDTENQLTDIFTKPLVEDRFNFIKEKLKIIKNPNIF